MCFFCFVFYLSFSSTVAERWPLPETVTVKLQKRKTCTLAVYWGLLLCLCRRGRFGVTKSNGENTKIQGEQCVPVDKHHLWLLVWKEMNGKKKITVYCFVM